MATLSGIAVLDSQQPASVVLVRDWLTHQHVTAVVPGAGGQWEAVVPVGTYDVTVVGPEGYQPQCDGPISARTV